MSIRMSNLADVNNVWRLTGVPTTPREVAVRTKVAALCDSADDGAELRNALTASRSHMNAMVLQDDFDDNSGLMCVLVVPDEEGSGFCATGISADGDGFELDLAHLPTSFKDNWPDMVTLARGEGKMPVALIVAEQPFHDFWDRETQIRDAKEAGAPLPVFNTPHNVFAAAIKAVKPLALQPVFAS